MSLLFDYIHLYTSVSMKQQENGTDNGTFFLRWKVNEKFKIDKH